MIEAVVFDLDSVLIQSEELRTNAREAFVQKQGAGGTRVLTGHDGHRFHQMIRISTRRPRRNRIPRNGFLKRWHRGWSRFIPVTYP